MAAIAKPLVTENNAQMRKRWCRDNWKRACDMVRWVVLRAVPYIRKSLHLENIQGSIQSRMTGSKVKHVGCSVWEAISWYSVGPIFIFHSRITARECVDKLTNHVHAMIQTLFPRSVAVCPHSYSWSCSAMVWRGWWWTSTSSMASIITKFKYHWTTLVRFGD
jgi:hypothetical protein